MLNVERFFDDLSYSLSARPESFEAALTSGAHEHWLATEASILLHSRRDDYGIGGYHKDSQGLIPQWWIAREAGLVDLFVAPERPERSQNETYFAFEFKVIRSESYKWRVQLDDLWLQISGSKSIHRNYDPERVSWYGIVLAFNNFFIPEFSRVKKAASLTSSIEMEDNFFSAVWGESEPYENWVVCKSWEVWSSKRSKKPQYLEKDKESSARIFLIQGKVIEEKRRLGVSRSSMGVSKIMHCT